MLSVQEKGSGAVATGNRLGPIGTVTAHRPILASGLIAVAAMALCAIAYSNAPIAAITRNISFLQMLGFCLVAPVAVASFAPISFAYRLAAAGGIALFALTLGIMARFAPGALSFFSEPGFGFFPAIDLRMIATSAAISSLLFLISPIWRPAFRYTLGGALGICLAVAAMQSLAMIMAEKLAPGAGAAVGEGAFVVAATGAGLTILSVMLFRFADAFSEGGDFRDAVGSAATTSAANAVFVLITLMVSAWSADIVTGGASAAALGDMAILGVFAAFAAASSIFIGGGAMVSAPQTELIAVHANQRRERIRLFVQRFRGSLTPSHAVALVAIVAILSLASLFDRDAPLGAVQIAACIGAGAAAAIAFVSIRAGLLFCFLVATTMFLGGWFSSSVFGQQSPLASWLAVTLTGVVFAPAALCWREARSPWLRPQLVTEKALIDCTPTVSLNMVFVLMVLAAANLSDYWADIGDLTREVLIMWTIAALLLAPVMTGLGALFGRD